MKVDSINASANLCRSESRNDMTDETISRGSAIAETNFTIMSMPSLVYAWFLFIMYLFSFIIASFPCALQNCDNRHQLCMFVCFRERVGQIFRICALERTWCTSIQVVHDKYDALLSQAIREFMTQFRDPSLSTWSVQEGVLRKIRSLQ